MSAAAIVIEESDLGMLEDNPSEDTAEYVPVHSEIGIPFLPLNSTESVHDVQIASTLNAQQRKELVQLCNDFAG